MSDAISYLTNIDPVMGGLIRAVGPCRLEAQLDDHPFQALAQAIAHQQLNGTAANTILKRFIGTCGEGSFPTPDRVLATPEQTLRAAGFSFSKIAALRDLAAKTLQGIVPHREALITLGDEEIIERLTQVRGIGRWTVEMMLMFQLGRPDVLPVDDFGVRNGFRLAYGLRKMPPPKVLAAYGERWSPHRSVAAWYLWRAVELDRDGKLPEPAERVRLPRVGRVRRVARAIKKSLKKAKRRAASLKAARGALKTPRRGGRATGAIGKRAARVDAREEVALRKAKSTRARR